ncbi:MAG TPA: glycoside hydrolase family 2 TIM barrel-domain containing protein [Terracidiphilus sp.]|nr:glycoside hydrolase family 2 TIM barrel-domain containing protein [Terracidiphilus sp.]
MKALRSILCVICCIVVWPLATRAQTAHRTTLSLDGTWDVADTVGGDQVPSAYHHTAPVPGLAHSAVPAFADVDQYQTRQLLSNLVRQGRYSQADYDKLGDARGISHQQRNYFWYRKTFKAPVQAAVALLKVNKAQFSTVVYLNGTRIGEHDPCFTAAYFDVTHAIRWGARNELVIRIGAHPGVLPANVSQGTDFEKNRWTPGIYDDVTLLAMNNPVIFTVQVAPQLASSSALIQTVLHNYSERAVTTEVRQQAFEWKSRTVASQKITAQVEVPASGEKTVTQMVPIPKAHLWSPEIPFLYQIATSTAGDDTTTRFGMREFRFDTATQRAYLNGRPYFLRGSNITLHRFFEDPEGGTLPWDEAWLHRLLVVIPKHMHWNAFRFCIGPVPDRWLEIADENGLLIQNEYMVWTGHPSWAGSFHAAYDTKEMIGEYSEWMRDNWNHPSVAIWDATNESWLPEFSSTIIPAVRGLDLSHRPWENSYNAPAGIDDPVEDHQYLFYGTAMNDPQPGRHEFQMADLESMMGPAPSGSTSKSAHAMILNEYGWLWLNRDGSPTLLTGKLYPRLLGDRNTTENRFALQAYLLGGETEFWRAYRRYAGVLHFVYLTASDPKAFTSDHFVDLKNLKLEPHFEKAMVQAFNPLGVYLNFWEPSLNAGEPHDYTVAMVNDEDRPRTGKLRLVFTDAAGKESTAAETPFLLAPLGAQSYTLTLRTPAEPGAHSLQAIAAAADDSAHPTISHRDVVVRDSASKN